MTKNLQTADLKGFDRRGLYRMKQFCETYAGNSIVSPLVTQLSWTNNLMILSKTKSIEEEPLLMAVDDSTRRAEVKASYGSK